MFSYITSFSLSHYFYFFNKLSFFKKYHPIYNIVNLEIKFDYISDSEAIISKVTHLYSV